MKMPEQKLKGSDTSDEIDAYFKDASRAQYVGSKPKSGTVAMLLWLFTTSIGYRAYMGDWASAGALVVLYFVAQHFVGVWNASREPVYLWISLAIGGIGTIVWIYDLIRMQRRLRQHNEGVAAAAKAAAEASSAP